jgi:hypothetical protein
MADPRRFPQDFDEVGGALADADYILATDVSDTTQSASGTVKKGLLSRFFTYVQVKYAAISEGGVALADADTFPFIDATDSTEKRSLLSRLWTYIQSKSAALSEGGVALADADTIPFIDATDSTEKRTLLSRVSTYIQTAIPIAFGSWTPTVTTTLNLDSTPTCDDAFYIRIGTRVLCAGTFNYDPTAGSEARFRFTLPVSSNFGASSDGAGVFGSQVAGGFGRVIGDATNDALEVRINNTVTTSSQGIALSLYKVI